MILWDSEDDLSFGMVEFLRRVTKDRKIPPRVFPGSARRILKGHMTCQFESPALPGGAGTHSTERRKTHPAPLSSAPSPRPLLVSVPANFCFSIPSAPPTLPFTN